MGGAVKALLEVGGVSILERLCALLAPRFAELLLVAKEPEPFAALAADNPPWQLALDALPGRSSLTGIHTALTNASSEHASRLGTISTRKRSAKTNQPREGGKGAQRAVLHESSALRCAAVASATGNG